MTFVGNSWEPVVYHALQYPSLVCGAAGTYAGWSAYQANTLYRSLKDCRLIRLDQGVGNLKDLQVGSRVFAAVEGLLHAGMITREMGWSPKERDQSVVLPYSGEGNVACGITTLTKRIEVVTKEYVGGGRSRENKNRTTEEEKTTHFPKYMFLKMSDADCLGLRRCVA